MREERFGEDFSWIFVRVQFSFCLAEELLATGRFVALNGEDFGVETDETVRGEKFGAGVLANE